MAEDAAMELRRFIAIVALAIAGALAGIVSVRAGLEAPPQVGPAGNDRYFVPTGAYVAPAGKSIAFFGRPSDLALDPARSLLAIKNSHGIVFVDLRDWRVRQDLPMPPLPVDFADQLGGNGPAGIVWNRDGTEVWSTDSFGWIHGARLGPDGTYRWADRIATGARPTAPVGLAWAADGRTLFVALSKDNAIAAVDTVTRRVLFRVPVGNAPFGVLRVGGRLYVTNWAGRRADTGSTADSSGTPVRVDAATGSASSGSVSIVDIATKTAIAEIDAGLHPSAEIASADGTRVFVADSNGDAITVISTASGRVVRTIDLDGAEPFGRTPTALALSHDRKTLYVAEGGADDVAVVDVATGNVRRRIAAGWYPAAVAAVGSTLYVADLKGAGSRAKDFHLTLPAATIQQRGSTLGYNVYDYSGIVQRIDEGAAAGERRERIVPGPEASVLSRFKHVIYIVKENHTYDDYFGDVAAGNGDPRLCAFCGKISPNHHALAARFGLFDNFYVNSVLSADGHNWTDEGFASDYVERSLSGFGRSYPSAGNDAMAYSPKGFIWNAILAHGLSFRDYGEFIPDTTAFRPANPSWSDFYEDYRRGTHHVAWSSHVDIASLRPYVATGYPSFALRIPDQVRAAAFLSDLRSFEEQRRMPSLMLLSLPNDHTSGTDPGRPTPRAAAADNDLALGRIVDAVSHSRFWNDTVTFVVEDDCQDGLDHVDGHRTMALVVSAYQQGGVHHEFYNQASILRTIELIFGLPPMTRFDASAPPIIAPFGTAARLEPYDALPNAVPLDELNPRLSELQGIRRLDALASQRIESAGMDGGDGAAMAQIVRRSLAE
jgi:YVTN family beta-propeller protein